MHLCERTPFRTFVVSTNNENQLIHYHSNHHFSKVQMKPQYSFMFLYQQHRPTVIEINVFSLMFETMSFHTDAYRKSLYFRLNTSSSTASMLVAVRPVLGRPLPAFLVIDPVCFKCITKSFNVFFFHPLAGNSFISLTAPQLLAKYKFLTKILSSTLKYMVFTA